MGKYRSYSPDFKAETVLESLRGQKSDAQICRERDIAADLLSRWRHQLLERAPLLFATEHSRSAEQAQIADLERLIGLMAVELDAAKNCRRSGAHARPETPSRPMSDRAVPGQPAVRVGCPASQHVLLR